MEIATGSSHRWFADASDWESAGHQRERFSASLFRFRQWPALPEAEASANHRCEEPVAISMGRI